MNQALWLVLVLAIPIAMSVVHAASDERETANMQRRLDLIESALKERRRPPWNWIVP